MKTNIEKGISNTKGREETFVNNKILLKKFLISVGLFEKSLEDLMVRILIASAIVQNILSTTMIDDDSTDWVDGVSIVLAILEVVLVGSITNNQKELKFHELNEIQ